MATVGRRGVRVVEATDMRELHDSVDVWETRCAELLRVDGTPVSSSDTPDRGVGPPT